MLDYWKMRLSRLTASELEQVAQALQEVIAAKSFAEELPDLEEQGEHIKERHRRGNIYYQLEAVKCGKLLCRCMNGGGLHGPYWYAYHYSPTLRTTKKGTQSHWKKQYIGKRRPSALDDEAASAGAGSVDRQLVEHYENLEGAVWRAIYQKDYAQARAIAARLPEGEYWHDLIQRSEDAARRCPGCGELWDGVKCSGHPIDQSGNVEGQGYVCDAWARLHASSDDTAATAGQSEALDEQGELEKARAHFFKITGMDTENPVNS